MHTDASHQTLMRNLCCGSRLQCTLQSLLANIKPATSERFKQSLRLGGAKSASRTQKAKAREHRARHNQVRAQGNLITDACTTEERNLHTQSTTRGASEGAEHERNRARSHAKCTQS